MVKVITVLPSTFSFLVLVATRKLPCEATMRQSSKMKQKPNVVTMLRESSQVTAPMCSFIHQLASYFAVRVRISSLVWQQ